MQERILGKQREKRQRIVNLRGDHAVRPTKDNRRHNTAQAAQHDAFQKERPADKPIRRPHIFHDRDLFAPCKDRQPDRVGNDEERRHRQHEHQRETEKPHEARDVKQVLHHVLPVFRRLHARHLRDGFRRRPHHIGPEDAHFEGIGQGIRLPEGIQQELLIPQPLAKTLHRRFTIDVLHRLHALHLGDSLFQRMDAAVADLVPDINADFHLGL